MARRWPRGPMWRKPFRCMSRTATSSSRPERGSLSAARASRFGRAEPHRRAPVGDGIMKLLEHKANGRQVFFLDRAVVVGAERFTEYGIHLALHGQQLFRSFRLAHPGNDAENLVPIYRVLFAFVPLQEVPEPGASRTEP